MAEKDSTVSNLNAVQVEEVDMAVSQALAVVCLIETDADSPDEIRDAAGAIRRCLRQARNITRGETHA